MPFYATQRTRLRPIWTTLEWHNFLFQHFFPVYQTIYVCHFDSAHQMGSSAFFVCCSIFVWISGSRYCIISSLLKLPPATFTVPQLISILIWHLKILKVFCFLSQNLFVLCTIFLKICVDTQQNELQMVFCSVLPGIKRKDLYFFHVLPIFTDTGKGVHSFRALGEHA